jgi:hypothetical protein
MSLSSCGFSKSKTGKFLLSLRAEGLVGSEKENNLANVLLGHLLAAD